MPLPSLANKNDFAAARANMVESQLRPNKVTDERILTAMETLPRELFVPVVAQGIAYVDEDIEIAKGRYLLEPMVFGRLLQEADIDMDERVLDLGCLGGYSTAVLAQLAGEVIAVDQDAAFMQQATVHLHKLGVINVQLVTGALNTGYTQRAPYNVIIVNGAVAEVPTVLTDQLAEGGRLMVVVRARGTATGKARLYTKRHGQVTWDELFDASTPYLPGFEPKPGFKF